MMEKDNLLERDIFQNQENPILCVRTDLKSSIKIESTHAKSSSIYFGTSLSSEHLHAGTTNGRGVHLSSGNQRNQPHLPLQMMKVLS
jgi:hypothetical protein